MTINSESGSFFNNSENVPERYCNNCKELLFGNTFVCSKCSYLNSLCSINCFIYLGLSVDFNIDMDTLENNYLYFMQLYHPDKYVAKSKQEQGNAISHSSFLNSAYETLKDPLLRVGYLYEMFNDVPIIADEKLLHNPALVMEFFDMYEDLDVAEKKEDLDILIIKLKTLKEDLFIKISKLDYVKDAQEIQDAYVKIIYINRILEKSVLKEKYIKKVT